MINNPNTAACGDTLPYYPNYPNYQNLPGFQPYVQSPPVQFYPDASLALAMNRLAAALERFNERK